MINIIDFGRSVPAEFFASIPPIAIVSTPSNITIAQFGVLTQLGGQVLLNETVGTQTTEGMPSFIYRIFRGNTLIFTLCTTSLQINQFNSTSLTFVDTGVT